MAERLTVVVTGARDWSHPEMIEALIAGLAGARDEDGGFQLLVGDCPTGADRHTLAFALAADLPCRVFEARWDEMAAEGKPRRAAGPLRNTEMLDALAACEGERLVVAFHDDLESSKGTLNCVHQAEARGLPVYLVSRL